MTSKQMNDYRSDTLLSKVPAVTLYFWVIKVLCTTVGETVADFLDVNLNFGLTGTSLVTGVLLVIVLFFQFRAMRYVPIIYWLTVALVSVFGTLITDNLTDKLGVPLEVTSIVFAAALAITFFVWYYNEKTLSIHSIYTRRREAFYWLAILFTFALGTASGDLMAESLGLGYATTGFIIAGLIALFAIGWRLKLNPILSFWSIYILTRPLGASIGDYLSQSRDEGGLDLGPAVTSYLFVAGIVALVAYLSITKRDTIGQDFDREMAADEQKGGLWQTVAVVVILTIAGGTGYHMRQLSLQSSDASAQSASPLGDLSAFRTITQDTLDKLNGGDQKGATTRIRDLETAWDNAEARLKPKSPAEWTQIDDKIDAALRQLRAVNPNAATEKTALQDLLANLNSDVSTQSASPLGDLSTFRTITQDTLDKLNGGDQRGATTRIRDLETEWDKAEARLKPKSLAEWTKIDDKIDEALRQLRAVNPNPATEKTALQDLLGVLT